MFYLNEYGFLTYINFLVKECKREYNLVYEGTNFKILKYI